MLIDVHQHIWTEPLVEALERRDALPFIRRERGLVMLHLAGERPCILDLAAETGGRRAALVREDGLDRALVCISSTIGIEALPRSEANALIDAYHEGVLDLPEEFAAWGALALDQVDPDEVDELVGRGFVGISLPAGALAVPDSVDRIEPALERADSLGIPVFVHPGPAPWTRIQHDSLSAPLWWPALTKYVAELSAAWLTVMASVRREHPELLFVFAALAGGAPLLAERLEARSGRHAPAGHDTFTFYETSSFDRRAVELIGRLVGFDQLVYGSDRPVVEPRADGRQLELARNGSRLLGGVAAARGVAA
jgi:predicted TIM-barrel fold metal-dependent hydrolase